MTHPIGARVKCKLRGKNHGAEGIVTKHWPSYEPRTRRNYDIYVVGFVPFERSFQGRIHIAPAGQGGWTNSDDWERLADPPLEAEVEQVQLEEVV